MRFKPILFIAIAVGLSSVSRSLELRGDLAPIVENGVSVERANYHILALVFLLAALGFFVSALVSTLRALRG